MKREFFYLNLKGYGGVWVKVERKIHPQVFHESYEEASCENENTKINEILH